MIYVSNINYFIKVYLKNIIYLFFMYVIIICILLHGQSVSFISIIFKYSSEEFLKNICI